MATNGLDILIGELNPEGDCVSEDCSSIHLCGITHFAKIDGFFPELKESEERIRKWIKKELENKYVEDGIVNNVLADKAFAWLEKQGKKEPNKMPIWKHWKDGICGNVESKPIYLIKNGDAYSISSSLGYECDYIELSDLNELMLPKQGEPEDKGEISDGYHTFNELYYYRMLYNAAFFNLLPKEWVHKSKRHHDGEECFGGGWFIVMAALPTGQISNHYELKDWDLFQIPEKEIADKWDGHTPQEAAKRLHEYLLEKQGGQKPALWSEEDEKHLQSIISILTIKDEERYMLTFGLNSLYKRQSQIRWLKSLKPQNHWKPTEEQMEAIRIAAEVGTANDSWAMDILKKLYNQLKLELKGVHNNEKEEI